MKRKLPPYSMMSRNLYRDLNPNKRAQLKLRNELGKSFLKMVFVTGIIYFGKRNNNKNIEWNFAPIIQSFDYSKKCIES